MQLIRHIAIKKFRSLYDAEFDLTKPLAVFHGPNDAGKSNVLRALNLFFNNKTNDGIDFNFERDFSRRAAKEKEKRRTNNQSDKSRQYVEIKVIFNTQNYKNSLGESCWVTRRWYSDGHMTETMSAKGKNKAHCSRFLGNIRYHYIPAIKDSSILSRLLGDIYEVLREQTRFREILKSFDDEVRTQTEPLSKELKKQLPLKSSTFIPPSDFSSLFQQQDFSTATDKDEMSLLLQHGDGIHVRHIPPILSFIAEKSTESKFHLWGVEEPENSLELSAAVAEARRFIGYSRQDNIQVFLTSHSPAFYTLDKDDCSKWFARKETDSLGAQTKWSELEKTEEIVKFMGDHKIFSSVFSTFERMHELKKLETTYRGIVATADKPVLFVEGECDKIVFEEAKRQFEKKFKKKIPLVIYATGGTDQMKPLEDKTASRLVSVISGSRTDNLVFVLTDNDGAGRSKGGQNPKNIQGSSWSRVGGNGSKVFWRRIPTSSEMKEIMDRYQIPDDCWPGVIENCFSAEVRKKAEAEGKYELSEEEFPDIVKHMQKELAPNAAARDDLNKRWIAAEKDDVAKFYLRAPGGQCKTEFAQYIVESSRRHHELLEWTESIFSDMVRKMEEAGVNVPERKQRRTRNKTSA